MEGWSVYCPTRGGVILRKDGKDVRELSYPSTTLETVTEEIERTTGMPIEKIPFEFDNPSMTEAFNGGA